MVRKKDTAHPAPEAIVPELPGAVAADELIVPEGIRGDRYECALSGSIDRWEDYRVGERIDHVDGMTIEESEHMMATRLYQNTARVHFNQHAEKDGRFGRRIVYGGFVISLARALSFNGLANAFKIVAINGGRHVSPAFAGLTVYAWSEVIEKLVLPGRNDLGALRLRTVATRDQACAGFPYKLDDGSYDPSVLLDFDYTVLMPRGA
jgi:2-methylfumaryl-CoA hydratase